LTLYQLPRALCSSSHYSVATSLSLGGNETRFTCDCTTPSPLQLWLREKRNRKKVVHLFLRIKTLERQTNPFMVNIVSVDSIEQRLAHIRCGDRPAIVPISSMGPIIGIISHQQSENSVISDHHLPLLCYSTGMIFSRLTLTS
uniref:Ig-like domain-containing protein n=1 Tax=Angiostrongylus cantonensis TaxID=6313 RepID=A0A0K0D348_ANGCA